MCGKTNQECSIFDADTFSAGGGPCHRVWTLALGRGPCSQRGLQKFASLYIRVKQVFLNVNRFELLFPMSITLLLF